MNNPLVNIKEHNFLLSPNKTIFWQNKNTILISDLHLGKASRPLNNFIPAQQNYELELERLKNAIAEFSAKRILILGDLFDVRSKVDRSLFKEAIDIPNVEITLVLGNHDVLEEQIYLDLGINQVLTELKEDMFLFSHKPKQSTRLNIHGHLHPGILLKSAKDNSKLPCFCFNTNSVCLPAFGGTTGKNVITPSDSKKIYVVANQFVRMIS